MREQKVTSDHLQRAAYLYIRQSSMRQVIENQESTKRQYALKNRALALGWRLDQIIVIDEDGLYDPGFFNDRLLLGLKGTMSEAEIHFLRARLQGGILNKAKRGELKMRLSVGFVYDDSGKTVIDPDRQVREAVEYLFSTFNRTGSAYAVVKHFRENGLKFPAHVRSGPHVSEIVWKPLYHYRVLQVLHNPRYTGTFVFGQTRTRKNPMDGKVRIQNIPQDEWKVSLFQRSLKAIFPGNSIKIT